MTLTSLGAVSNSANRVFSNAVGNIAIVNYNRVLGSVVPVVPVRISDNVKNTLESKKKSRKHKKDKKNKKDKKCKKH